MAINIIEYITKNMGLKQQDIAKKLGVTTGQISKWKNGEYISADRKRELDKLAGLFSGNLDWTIISKTKENADAWFIYIDWHSENHNRKIDDMGDFYIPRIFTCLSSLGAKIPDKAPPVHEMDNDNYEFTSFDSVISELLDSYATIVQWNDQVFENFVGDPGLIYDEDIRECVFEIEAHALDIAMRDINILDRSELLSIGIKEKVLDSYISKTKKEVNQSIKDFLKLMNRNGLPITQDYFLVINQNAHWLEDEMMLLPHRNHVLEYLSYADKNLLETQKYSIMLLESLNRKVDTLLSDENKKRFIDDPDTLMEDS